MEEFGRYCVVWPLKRHFVKALKFSLKIRLMIIIYIEYVSKAGLTQ